eukprot:TRINITY_DN6535_c0_g1_i1.p1 TRINITY_DN6535_c0_g1~~TRINITY_DN6535_c0_g1_i1.p1  ORF type:complete len:284 (-),score=39.47 TRINITY_DN6535_c0_g1_i1:82-933(-)
MLTLTPSIWTKIGCSIGGFLIPLVFGFGVFHPVIKRNHYIRSLGNSFGGGIFLTTAIVHILPEIAEADDSEGFPWNYLFILLGYMLFFFLDKFFSEGHSHGHSESSKLLPNENAHDRDGHINMQKKPKRRGIPNSILLLVPLTIHGLLEGSVIGIHDHFDELISITIAVLCHKPAEAIALGVQLLEDGIRPSVYTIILIWNALLCPIGIGIGILLKEGLPPVVVNVFSAITVGSFLFIAASHILPEEFEKGSKKNKSGKLFCMMLGVLVICAITALHDDDHDH